jgi:hypothetical protein
MSCHPEEGVSPTKDLLFVARIDTVPATDKPQILRYAQDDQFGGLNIFQ